ncbi:hypothetical protein CPB85DRAFT_1483664 [Mucidula mucida]|nr:hypothetical protein CPB85DRAFT_1483664 [Mucidula mucida]
MITSTNTKDSRAGQDRREIFVRLRCQYGNSASTHHDLPTFLLWNVVFAIPVYLFGSKLTDATKISPDLSGFLIRHLQTIVYYGMRTRSYRCCSTPFLNTTSTLVSIREASNDGQEVPASGPAPTPAEDAAMQADDTQPIAVSVPQPSQPLKTLLGLQ